jgi:dolichol kinase
MCADWSGVALLLCGIASALAAGFRSRMVLRAGTAHGGRWHPLSVQSPEAIAADLAAWCIACLGGVLLFGWFHELHNPMGVGWVGCFVSALTIWANHASVAADAASVGEEPSRAGETTALAAVGGVVTMGVVAAVAFPGAPGAESPHVPFTVGSLPTAWRATALEVSSAFVTVVLAAPFLADTAVSVRPRKAKRRILSSVDEAHVVTEAAGIRQRPVATSSEDKDARPTPPADTGVVVSGLPATQRCLGACGCSVPASVRGSAWKWVGLAVLLSAVAWDMGVGWALLGENPVWWVIEFVCSDRGSALGVWRDESVVFRWVVDLMRPLQVALVGDAGSPVRLAVCALWMVCIPLQLFLAQWLTFAGWSTITVRKAFHIALAVMLSPVIAMDPAFVAIAAAGMLRVFAAAEVLRAAGTPLLSTLASSIVAPFIDSRDEGGFVLTHAYLLAGCALPVWMLPFVTGDAGASQWLLWGAFPHSGVLAVAVADAASAAIGKAFGRRKWLPSMSKTVEGTLAGATAASVGLVLLAATVRVPTTSGPWTAASLVDVLVAVGVMCLTSLHETFTGLIDNIASPAFAAALMGACAFVVRT